MSGTLNFAKFRKRKVFVTRISTNLSHTCLDIRTHWWSLQFRIITFSRVKLEKKTGDKNLRKQFTFIKEGGGWEGALQDRVVESRHAKNYQI